MKNADQAELEWDCRPNALIRPLSDEFSVFRLYVVLCRGGRKRSTISLKKAGLVYDLTEIDSRCIHLFYAGPVSLAFHLGQQISENIHPPVIVWNYRREQGYNWAVDLLRACREEGGVGRGML
jgi:hypothetical protein